MTGGISEAYGSLDGMGLAALVRQGEVSPSEVLEEAIRRAEAVNGTLNFLTYKAYEEGREMAADPALPDGPFKGVPWLVKEIATDWTRPAEHQRLPLLQGRRVHQRQRAGEARSSRRASFCSASPTRPRPAGRFPPSPRCTVRRSIPGTRRARPAAPPAARQQRWRPACCRWRKPATAAAPSARPHAIPASSASSPRAGASQWRQARTSGTAA